MSFSSKASPCRPTDATELMPAGTRYAGEPIDLSSKRSVQLPEIEGRPQRFEEQDSHAVVDHFYHEGSYWRAVIALDGIRQVCGQSINFSKPRTRKSANGPELVRDEMGAPQPTWSMLNHLQTRITMLPDHPIELHRMDADDLESPTHTIEEFVYTVEAVGPSGVEFNLRDALRGNLISVHRFMSLQEVAFERLAVQNQWVRESPPLPLSPANMRSLLVASLIRAHQAGVKEQYYMVGLFRTSNCTSHPFRILDTVVDYKWHERLGSLLYRLPFHPRFYLRVRGLYTDPKLRKIFREEFADYVRDKATQERKREYVRGYLKARRARAKQAMATKS